MVVRGHIIFWRGRVVRIDIRLPNRSSHAYTISYI